MKWVKIILALLFLSFAWVQLDDLDPFGWVAIYLATAIACGMAAFDRYYTPFIGTLGIAALLWMAGLVPEVFDWLQKGAPNIAGQMKAASPYIEFTREFFGLFLIVLVSGWLFRQGRASQKKTLVDNIPKGNQN